MTRRRSSKTQGTAAVAVCGLGTDPPAQHIAKKGHHAEHLPSKLDVDTACVRQLFRCSVAMVQLVATIATRGRP